MQTQTFLHNGKQYEIRIASDGYSVFVRVFLDNKPANGIRYEVSLSTVFDASKAAELDLVKELVSTAEADIKRG